MSAYSFRDGQIINPMGDVIERSSAGWRLEFLERDREPYKSLYPANWAESLRDAIQQFDEASK